MSGIFFGLVARWIRPVMPPAPITCTSTTTSTITATAPSTES